MKEYNIPQLLATRSAIKYNIGFIEYKFVLINPNTRHHEWIFSSKVNILKHLSFISSVLVKIIIISIICV